MRQPLGEKAFHSNHCLFSFGSVKLRPFLFSNSQVGINSWSSILYHLVEAHRDMTQENERRKYGEKWKKNYQ
jgi:hypothetical protein